MTLCVRSGSWNQWESRILIEAYSHSLKRKFSFETDNMKFRSHGRIRMHPVLPTNYQLCLKRFHGLFHRLQQNPSLLEEYDTIIQNQVQQRIVQPVEDSEATETENVHYLPHHAVVRQDKETTKLRIVYDASAKSTGPSLNDCLHTGPKFDQRILDILLRFRTHRVALTADIEKPS